VKFVKFLEGRKEEVEGWVGVVRWRTAFLLMLGVVRQGNGVCELRKLMGREMCVEG
jgi:hypothetical protein